MKRPEIIFQQVYYVESKRPRNPVGIRPYIEKDLIEWENTSSGSYVRFSKISITPQESKLPDEIKVITVDGEKITFRKLTLELYNQRVKEFVAGSPDFASDEDLQNYYLETNFQAY